MRKLILIAAMLLLPAAALATTIAPPPNYELIVSTGFEDCTLGGIHGQNAPSLGGHFWGNWDGTVQVIDDPYSTGHGQVLAWDPPGFDPEDPPVNPPHTRHKLFVDRKDYDWDIWYTVGHVSWTCDYYIQSDLLETDFPNLVDAEGCGPNTTYYLDGSWITPGDTVELWTGGAQWDPLGDWDGEPPGGGPPSTLTLGALPLDTWFSVTMDFRIGTQDVDMYINGALVAEGQPMYFNGANSVHWQYWLINDYLWNEDLEANLLPYMLIDNVEWYWEIPEPSVLLLGGIGVLALLRRKKK